MPTWRDRPHTDGQWPVQRDTVSTEQTVETEVIRDPTLPPDTEVIPPPPSPPPLVPPNEPVAPLAPRDPTNRIGLALLTILLLAGAAVLGAMLLARDDNERQATTTTATRSSAAPATPVPDLTGLSRRDAEAALRGAGFGVVVATVPGPAPAGQVLAQNPSGGAQPAQGTAVRINVSNGTQGTTPGAAESATTADAGSTIASGQATTPATTATNRASTTTAAPTPSPPVSVPTLTGQVKAAVQGLARAGLPASIQYVPGADPLGTVLAQSPEEGTKVRSGSHVTLSVSSGPGDKESITVPDTTGQRIKQAVATLNAAGLRLILLRREVDDQSLAGTVVEQTPRAGADAPRNAQVLVYMGAYAGG
jgi:beta-lactam-binding protein with PASTA domain